ncbi:unnamed protein product [Peniophora sp. CBMAI 1063]|nr:unnamed protein product [Peniophora sp. CBMAI 1063]
MDDETIEEAPTVVQSQAADVEISDWTSRSRLNATRPVGRLPAEVLSLIFLIYALERIPSLSIARKAQGLVLREQGSGWLDVTHVCRAWRHAALGYPALWSCCVIPLDLGQDWAREFLTRSGTTTLSVTLDIRDFKSRAVPTWVQDLLRPHLHRTGQLQIASGEWSSLRTLDNIGDAALRLIEVDLSFGDCYTLVPSSNAMRLLNAPSLASIRLQRLTCDFSRVAWPSLRTLNIQSSDINSKEILQALNTAPFLEDVFLHNVLSSSSALDPSPRVPLTALRRLTVMGDGPGVMTVWRGLILAPSASATFDMHHYPMEHEDVIVDVDTVLHLIRAHSEAALTAGRSLVKCMLKVASDVSLSAFDSFNRDDPFDSEINESESQSTILHAFIPIFALPDDTDMTSFTQAIPLGGCEVLDLDTNHHVLSLVISHPCTTNAWTTLIPQTESIKILRISGPGAFTLAKAAVTGLERGTYETLFPHLQDLYLYRISFAGQYQTLTANDTPSFCVALLLWINLRNRYGLTPIRKLVIRECNLYSEWLAPLEAVEHLIVDWDGSPGSCRGHLDEDEE